MEYLKDIDEYIATFPEDVRTILQKLRLMIREEAPDAEERIAYGMPTFFLNGNLIHFAAFKNHIGVYPTPEGIEAFREELAGYKNAKGSVQFPLDREFPFDLIRRIVRYRVEDNRKKPPRKNPGNAK